MKPGRLTDRCQLQARAEVAKTTPSHTLGVGLLAPKMTLFAAVTFLAWYAGQGPAILAHVLGSSIAATAFFTETDLASACSRYDGSVLVAARTWKKHRGPFQFYPEDNTSPKENDMLSKMKSVFTATLIVAAFVSAHLPAFAQDRAQQAMLDANAIGEAAGAKATATEDGVVRIGWARTDVPVKVDGLALKPFAGLGSWAAFMPTPHGAMVMGDTVVFQDEVTPAMDAAFAHGLEVSALHNHFFFDVPKVYFMHIGGQGDAQELAAGVKAVWDAIKQVRAERPKPAESFPGKTPNSEGTINAQQIERILGYPSDTQDGVVKVTIGREAEMHGVRFGGSLGLTTWAAFSGSDDLAAVDGDFAMTAAEVQPVLQALRKNGIHIVALHNHMIAEKPAIYFTHFWGKGPAPTLAEGIKAALDAQRAAVAAAQADSSPSHANEK